MVPSHIKGLQKITSPEAQKAKRSKVLHLKVCFVPGLWTQLPLCRAQLMVGQAGARTWIFGAPNKQGGGKRLQLWGHSKEILAKLGPKNLVFEVEV